MSRHDITHVQRMREARERLRQSGLFSRERISAQRDARVRQAAIEAIRNEREGNGNASHR